MSHVVLGIWNLKKIMYSESPSRFVVGVSKSKREEFEQLFKGDFCACIGEVTEKKRSGV